MRLVAGNRYLPCDGLGEFAMLNFGGLTVRGWGWENCVKCFEKGGGGGGGGEWKNKVGKLTFPKTGWYVGKGWVL